jgi:nicotinate-nucleotide pyrophosphorylase (carboxylating)
MNANTQIRPEAAASNREALIRRAYFHGEHLRMSDEHYRAAVAAIIDPLLWSDAGSGDMTFEALQLGDERASAKVIAKEKGIAAGIEEFSWLLTRGDATVNAYKKDGEEFAAGDLLAQVEGRRGGLLSCERTALNLLQRMCGIASVTHRLQETVHRRYPHTFLVGTRKTPWGLLDKRAIHLGGGGTHRLGLHDAILIKNNHLALLDSDEEKAVVTALERAWTRKEDAAFIEVEVRSEAGAIAAAKTFQRLKNSNADSCPALLLLDNMSPEKVKSTIAVLEAQNVRDQIVIEISGKLNEGNLEEYAACGADALSLGALTHSPRALDISMSIS